MAYTPDSIWRNRDQFFQGRDAIEKFLAEKWAKENGYRLRKELFAFRDNKVRAVAPPPPFFFVSCLFFLKLNCLLNRDEQIAVQFWYEWHDKEGQWWRSYGLEDWTFAENGLMRKRQNSTNDVKISEEERWFKNDVDVSTVDISEVHW